MDDYLQTGSVLPPEFAEALARICEAEGIDIGWVRSIEIVDREVSVRFERPGGGSRIVTYPSAMLGTDGAEPSAVLEVQAADLDRRAKDEC